ncbi:MAG: fluoride efflux transporter CrcB [Bacteroidota bacterium]|nr:fluoride efflux transporter CrcB [Bacteroidota bacterium]
MKLLLIIGSGGFLGSIARYLTSLSIHKYLPVSFPYGTLIVNILGCFLIGLFYGLAERGNLMSTELRMFLTVGFCGGYTTFSTFANDNLGMLRDGAFVYVALYTGLSVMLGLLATYLGSLLVNS